MGIKGKILHLHDYSVNDGSGIRTTVFFAGCSLSCRWCANPEGWEERNRILYVASRCVRCGRYVAVCPNGISFDFLAPHDCERCTGCGACTEACLTMASKNIVTEYTAKDIIKHLEQELNVLRRSGSGVAYSGGECTAQAAFLSEISGEVYDTGLSQDMETSGYFDLKELSPVLQRMDLLFIDIKCMDAACHHEWTGVDNGKILKNIAALGKKRGSVVIRVPVIMGVNWDDGNIRVTARFAGKNMREPMMELIPYHSYGADKYTQLGLTYNKEKFRTPSKEELRHLKKIIESEDVRVVSFA